MIERGKDRAALEKLLKLFPVVAILGPRQAGKTTLAGTFHADHIFDLENPRDLALLSEPQLALEPLSGLIIIDEIQRAPDLFPLIRYLVDSRPDQRYLILGSASRALVRQSSETLAGRIGYHNLQGLRLQDVGEENWRKLWLRGGLPRAYSAQSDADATLWLENYIATFLERDIPQLGITIPAPTLRRFWSMLCHYHGQELNYSEFSRSFGISDMTVRRYIDILEGTFMVRVLQPWHNNTTKRLCKRPKVFVRDSGVLHSLLSVASAKQLVVHNKLGASWEGFALEQIARVLGKRTSELYFWRTHGGAEVDLFWQAGGRNWAVEVKYADAPRSTKSMHSAIADLELERLWVIYPGDREYPLAPRATALPLASIATLADPLCT